jgi:hypothetical protein
VDYKYLSTTIYALVGLGYIRSIEGRGASAVELFRLALNHPITPALYKDIAQRELDRLKAQMSADEFEAAEERGGAMDIEKVVESVVRERGVN